MAGQRRSRSVLSAIGGTRPILLKNSLSGFAVKSLGLEIGCNYGAPEGEPFPSIYDHNCPHCATPHIYCGFSATFVFAHKITCGGKMSFSTE
jgi:hypothetical protein